MLATLSRNAQSVLCRARPFSRLGDRTRGIPDDRGHSWLRSGYARRSSGHCALARPGAVCSTRRV